MATAYKRTGSPFWWIHSHKRFSSGFRHNGSETLPVPLRNIIEALNSDHKPGWQPVSIEDAIKYRKFVYSQNGEVTQDHALSMCNLLDSYLPHLKAAGINYLNDLTPELALKYKSQRGVRDTTLKKEVGHLSALWLMYIKEQKAPIDNHWSTLKLNNKHDKKRSLTAEEVDVLTSLLPDAPIEMQYLTRMGLMTGARCAQAVRLKYNMVDWDSNQVHYPKVKKTEHTVHLPPALWKFLRSYPTLEDGSFLADGINWSAKYCNWMENLRKHTCLLYTSPSPRD